MHGCQTLYLHLTERVIPTENNTAAVWEHEATAAEFSDVWEKHMCVPLSVCVCDSETPQTQRAACDWTSWRLGYMPGKHEQYRVGKHGVFLTRSQMCRRAA